MGFLSGLAKIGGYVAAPFTGGASIPIGNSVSQALDSFSTGAGRASQGMASNRGTQAELQLDAHSALERELLAREQEKRDAQNDAYKNQIRGSLAANWQSPSGPPGVNVIRFGGANGPANDQSREAGGGLFNRGSARMAQPDLMNQTGMPAYTDLMKDPNFLKNLHPSKSETGLGWASALSPLAGLLLNRQQNKPPQANNPPQYGYNPQTSIVGPK